MAVGRPLLRAFLFIMDNIKTMNAVIESVSINDAARGLLTAYLYLKHEDGNQGFGGYSLYLPKNFTHHQLMSCAGHFIWRCMEIAGVDSWEKLPGKTIRVKAEHSKIHEIGNIINNDWFNPALDFSEQK